MKETPASCSLKNERQGSASSRAHTADRLCWLGSLKCAAAGGQEVNRSVQVSFAGDGRCDVSQRTDVGTDVSREVSESKALLFSLLGYRKNIANTHINLIDTTVTVLAQNRLKH